MELHHSTKSELTNLFLDKDLDVNHLLAGNVITWISGGAITLAIIGAGLALYFLDIHRRDKMLNLLKRNCERRIWWKGIPDDQVIEDIRYLGEQGKTRGEKIQALEILEKLTAKVQAHKRYQGNGLEGIIEAIESIIRPETDADSFMKGIFILKSIAEKSQNSEHKSLADRDWVLRALQRLGNISCAMDNKQPARIILDAIEFVSRAPNSAFAEATLGLFDLGIAALEYDNFLIAAAALNKLEAMTWPKEPLDAAHSSAYLGLIAHFWVREGSGRQRALSGLKGVRFRPSRRKCLISAQEFFYRTARFNTADLLSKMIAAK
jgi:hypothetical protein